MMDGNKESVEKIMEENQMLLKKLDKIKGMILEHIETLTKDLKSKDVYHHSAGYFPRVHTIIEGERLFLSFLTHEF